MRFALLNRSDLTRSAKVISNRRHFKFAILAGILIIIPIIRIRGEDLDEPSSTTVGKSRAGEIVSKVADPSKKSDDLFLFNDIPIVISGSRQPEKSAMSSSAISILTKEDIHYSGIMSLPEVFNFV